MRYEQKTWDTSWWTYLSSWGTREPCQISWKPGWFRPKTSRPDKATGLHDFETAFCENVSRVRGWKHKSIRENSSLPSPSWLWVTTSAISCFQKVLTVTNEWNLWSALTFLVNGHIMLNAPVLVRSPKLSSIEPRQYLDGWPPGNTGCCWQINFFFCLFSIYTEILTRKVVSTCFFIGETSEKIHNSTFLVKISV